MSPTVTYRVPAGWYNSSDEPGEFSLLPPGGNLAGVDAGTSDFLGVYSTVAEADPKCGDGTAPGVGLSVHDIANAIDHQPGLATTKPRPVSIGGLSGVVLDIELAKGWTKTCPWSSGHPVVALIMGIGDSSFSHAVGPRYAVRLYLLAAGAETRAIEVDDATGGQHLDIATSVINSFKFG